MLKSLISLSVFIFRVFRSHPVSVSKPLLNLLTSLHHLLEVSLLEISPKLLSCPPWVSEGVAADDRLSVCSTIWVPVSLFVFICLLVMAPCLPLLPSAHIHSWGPLEGRDLWLTVSDFCSSLFSSWVDLVRPCLQVEKRLMSTELIHLHCHPEPLFFGISDYHSWCPVFK